MNSLITDFDIIFKREMERVERIISSDALVGKDAIETVDYLNKYEDSPLTELNTFLNANGFINTFFMAVTRTVDEMSYINILVIRSGVPVTSDNFKEFVDNACMRGYLVKLTRYSGDEVIETLYLQARQDLSSENPAMIFMPSRERGELIQDFEMAKQIVTNSAINTNIYKVTFVQVHDEPFHDREINLI